MCTSKGKVEDCCGPKIVNLKTWLLAKLIPEDMWGVDLKPACRSHDAAYGKGGKFADKKKADKQFRDDIYTLLMKSGKVGDKKATIAAELYYIGVVVGGGSSFSWSF